MVAFGLIPSNATESTGQPTVPSLLAKLTEFSTIGDTIGGIGSAIALKRGTFRQEGDIFTGTLTVQPDRGFNV